MRSDLPSFFGWPFARLWARFAPNQTTPVAILGPDPSQPIPTNVDVAIVPRGTGALLAAIPDGTISGGDKRGPRAVDFQTTRNAATAVASGTNSSITGGYNNTANGSSSFIGAGEGNVVSAYTAVSVGGNANTASAGAAFVGGGSSNSATAISATVSGGDSNTANGTYSTVPGGASASTRALYGRLSYASGTFASVGDAQYGLHVLRRQTTDATVTVLTASGSTPSASTIPVLPNTSFYAFRLRISCIQSAGTAGTAGDCKAWDVVGAIKRGAAAANTALVGTPAITLLGADTGLGADNATGAIISITADTTNGGLSVNVTGEANKTLRWVATVETTEVDY